MPSAADLGIVAGGTTDQSALIISALSNPAYSGIVFDFPSSPSSPAKIYISNSISANGKVLKFVPGTYLTGPTAPTTPVTVVSGFVLDCGVRQQCFDPGCGLQFDPIGTTLGKISPWVFGVQSDDSTHNASPGIQKTIDLIIRNIGVQTLFIPAGTYYCGSPLICYKWSGTEYSYFQISIEGECNFWEASGYGTILNFAGFHDTFGIGLHRTKGSSIKNIKLAGAWNYKFPDQAYTFYNLPLSAFTDGVCRDTTNSPYAGIVIDPFSPTVPAAPDNGYPGLTSYYRGSDTGGSTGVTLEDVHIDSFVIGFITSPNGQTKSAELIRAEKIQFSNMKICIVGCQDQEKMNVFRHVGCWGTCHTIFLSGVGSGAEYGASTPGNWYVEDMNIAGYNNQLIYNNQGGYFASYFKNIYAELLGSLGSIASVQGSTFECCTINFANYVDAGSYQMQIQQAVGVTFIGCSFRMYGTFKPITIDSGNGGPVFDGCSFETAPFMRFRAPVGDTQFINCTDESTNARNTLGPVAAPAIFASSFSNTNAYGSHKINTSAGSYTLNSPYPALPMPISLTGAPYVINKTTGTAPYQATVACTGDELNRIVVGDVIVGTTSGDDRSLIVMGIVSATGTGNFTINYVPAAVTSGTSYWLYVWLPLYNISFTGDTTSGSNQITNVSLIAGDLPTFISRGGLLSTAAVKYSDSWHLNLIRLLSYNATTGVITFDKTSSSSAKKNLFTNTDAVPDAMTPSISAGPGAGTSPVVVITKGNDRNMQVSVTTGGSTVAAAVIATISMGIPYSGGYIPSPKFSPANAAAAALSGATQVFMDAASSAGYTISAGAAALTASTLYLWNIEVG